MAKKWTDISESVSGPQGEFEVSTVRMFAGGAPDERPQWSPFSKSDYAADEPWPFETMVFHAGSRTGLYHEPHASEQQARDGHAFAVSTCKAGTLQIGAGVRGDFGTPAITAAEWRERQNEKASK